MVLNDLPQVFIDTWKSHHFATDFNHALLQLVDILNTQFKY